MDKKRTKSLLITIFAIILFVAIIYLLYVLLFDNKKSDGSEPSPSTSTPAPQKEYVVSDISPIILESGQEIILNDKNVTIKSENGNLMINEKQFSNINAEMAYVTDYYILFTQKKECGDKVVLATDIDGNEIKNNSGDKQLFDFRIYDNKCMANSFKVCPCTEEEKNMCAQDYLVITYNGSEINYIEE